jgi:hypothetical protein
MRLASLTTDIDVEIAVKDESIKDTVKDIINYASYIPVLYEEMRENALRKKE